MDQVVKIHQHCWKESLKNNNMTKFENDLLRKNEDIIAQQSYKILQMLIWWGVPTCLSHHAYLCKILWLCRAIIIFAHFRSITFKPCRFNDVKVLFSAVYLKQNVFKSLWLSQFQVCPWPQAFVILSIPAVGNLSENLFPGVGYNVNSSRSS